MNPVDPSPKRSAKLAPAAAIVFVICFFAFVACWALSHDPDLPARPAPQSDQGALPVTAAPYIEPPSQSPPVFLRPYIEQYDDDYDGLLGTPGEDWVVGNIIAHPDPSGYTTPVGDMTDWPSTVEIVAGTTPAERAQTGRSAHGYATCDIQQGGSTTEVGSVRQQDGSVLPLYRYTAPAEVAATKGTPCEGGEYFFFSPDQTSKMMSQAFSV